VVATIVLTLSSASLAQEQRGRDKHLCSEAHPETMCNAENTCGSSDAACTIEIKRTASAASITPSLANAKANMPFCTKMTWRSLSKNTGFVVDFGLDAPMGTQAIVGGSDRSVSAVAKQKGCYNYSTGACVSGAIDGMCASVETKLIITGSE
jgi:hypothetical protein